MSKIRKTQLQSLATLPHLIPGGACYCTAHQDSLAARSEATRSDRKVTNISRERRKAKRK